MIDHVSLEVADYNRSKSFYAEALGPLGYEPASGLQQIEPPEVVLDR
jgi:catechol 2,3-dioxygenase-like lactoylglutathione lyase family enzyme